MRTKLRKLTREDIAMVLELISDGLKLGFIAFYAFSMTYQQLYSQMKVWRAL